MSRLLEVAALAKAYVSGPPWRRSRIVALESVDLALDAGEVLAIRGANGAGKTTLLKILASLVKPDHGTVRILGRQQDSDPDLRGHVGFASGDERSLFFRLTGEQNLEFFAALQGLRARQRGARIAELARALDLDAVLGRRVDRCSSGMRTRLGLARALLHRPALLLLDEPTKSLDPEHAARAQDLVLAAAKEGAGVVLATHSAAEAAAIATSTAVLEGGGLVFGAPAERLA